MTNTLTLINGSLTPSNGEIEQDTEKSQGASMGLMKGAADFLGLSRPDESKKAQILKEINLTDAINAHIKWKIRLQDYLSGISQEKLDPMVICRDDQCVLGKWIHGPALKHLHGDATFQQLCSDHAQFHSVAGNVVRHVHASEYVKAVALMEGEYKRSSRKVVLALNKLNEQVNG